MAQPNIIFSGSLELLASHLVAHRLFPAAAVILCRARPLAFESFISQTRSVLSEIYPPAEKDLVENIRRIEPDEPCVATEVWHFADVLTDERVEFANLANTLRNSGVETLNYVAIPYCGARDSDWVMWRSPTSKEPVDLSSIEVPNCRVFTTSMTISSSAAGGREGFLYFLNTLFALKTEIEERLPDYFEYQALRCRATADATINVIPVQHAARTILSLAKEAPSGRYIVTSPQSYHLTNVLERVGVAYNLSLLPEENPEALNAVDALFDLRLMGFAQRLAVPANEDGRSQTHLEDQNPVMPEAELEQLFDDVYRRQSEAAKEFCRRANDLGSTLIKKQIEFHGHDLVYHSSGAGEKTIVLLNAIGQGPQYWLRLIELLRPRFRVLIWDLRGIHVPPRPSGISDHANDLEAILDHEGVSECHIVAWCTGPKLAVKYYLRHPESVCSMVFLNTTVKCLGSPAELDTKYERDFEPLCRVLDQRPSMAESIRSSLSNSSQADIDLSALALGEDVSEAVLRLTNVDLRTHVLHPFSDATALLNYVQQVKDFWNYDIRPKAPDVHVPVLLVSSEHDRVAAPAASEAVATLFPSGKRVHIQGATHYFLYDRADVTAHLIKNFLEDAETTRAQTEEVAAVTMA
jgi:pimeloyl-ACP methyl ester carboxylesterase